MGIRTINSNTSFLNPIAMARKDNRVNGRPSTGCEFCRKRKIKCDEQKPVCTKCNKRGLQCRYRDQVQIWFWDQTEEVVEKSRVSTIPPRFQADPRERTGDECLLLSPKIISGDAINRDFVLGLAVKYCLPEWYLAPNKINGMPARYYMCQSMGSYCGNWSPIANIMTALSYTRCSQITGDIEMRRKGLEMYQHALVSIRNALYSKTTTFAPETILAIGMMSVFAALEEAAGGKGELHSSAFVNLIRIMGPEAMKSDPMHDIFSICRVHAICQALQERRATFFSQKDWLTLPFKNRQKGNYNLMADLVAELCTYLEASDILDSPTSSLLNTFQARLNLQTACLYLRTRFSEWATSARTLTESPLPRYMDHETARAGSLDPNSSATASFYIPLEFDKFETAETYLLYWTACLMLSQVLKSNNTALLALHSQSSSPDPQTAASPTSASTSSTPPLKSKSKTRSTYLIPDSTIEDFDMATSIAASMEYCLRQDNGMFGVGPVILPLNTAMSWFQSQPSCWQRLKWCTELLQLMPLIQAGQLFRGLKVSRIAIEGEGEGSVSVVEEGCC
ncbi:hypothetical protein VTL71DRAFT_7440 [Oculimacula yallundae]|uniref:Zn(2)-C6 fungal-type domain-containing protein n=1 Tax=Oculimacula yallundae TaxID=86028 RepID=A0ABR4BU40_9HELO